MKEQNQEALGGGRRPESHSAGQGTGLVTDQIGARNSGTGDMVVPCVVTEEGLCSKRGSVPLEMCSLGPLGGSEGWGSPL